VLSASLDSPIERYADHYPVEHWLFGCSRIPADGCAASDCLTSVRRTEPASTDRSLRGQSGSSYSVLREWPPLGGLPPWRCPSGVMPVCRVRVEPFSNELPGRRRSRCPDRGDRSPRACPGRAAVLTWFPLACSGSCGRDARPRVRAVETLENSKASTSIFVLQATKSQRRMPWRLRPKKDVGDCDKPREAVYQASIRGCPNGETQHLS
jgi:hypothetical protein